MKLSKKLKQKTPREQEWGVKKFEKWCEKRKINLQWICEYSEILQKFFAEVKTEKGCAFTPSA